ncbi:hypothetical protein [Urbifossiella limnaea]|uniref:Glycosyltransferase RgtA/B/C/D-like domain-containing protein n=1 Tax=Urbifossiella limnaea TaxID=2528023 RepID=A0A517XYT1_9BACT|nr:hypothetical protein [Urbifossiella limnaea]QDU22674.1 hypothetical protein ETAA1_46580 [Urbifossiella limnaea]
MKRWPDALWLLLVGVYSSAWCVTAAAELGATFDEPFYLASGLNAWRTGSNKPLMSAGTLPLAVDAQTLPLYLWERGRGEPFHVYREMDVILPAARAANLPFWWLLLLYAMRLGRTWGGVWGGRIAVGLVGFDPNLLGHAALATTDIPIVAMMLALVYHAHQGAGRGWWPRVFVPGVCFGLATLAKASGMVFGVQALVVIGLWHLAKAGALTPTPGTGWIGRAAHVWHACHGLRKDIAVSLLVGFTLVFVYTGSDWVVEPTFVTWAAGLPDGPVKDVLVPVSTHLRVFPNAGEAMVQQVKHNFRGHGTYLLGEWHDRATLRYFPLALAMKTPLPALLLVLLTLAVRPRAWNTPAGWFALLLLLFSLNCRVQIGVRFMFTLMAVAYVCAAAAASRGVLRWVGCGLVAVTAGVSLSAWPHGLGYFNRLWGDPALGYTHLHDSNFDWGQGLPELKAWYAAQGGGRPLAVWYYGTDPDILYPPFRHVPVSHAKLTRGDQLPGVAGRGLLAVSVTSLYGNRCITPSTRVASEWVLAREPVGRTHTFLIYDLARE